ncbi:MAG: NAD(P)-binding domain-containing protein [Sinobacteraceae bacterium]|nr:NAD(P)-binding domain-containing protein [Nevskiaceae bacterium]
MTAWTWIVYPLPLLLIWRWYLRSRRRALAGAAPDDPAAPAAAGEPVSLHPVIDAALCVGCRECVKACPETPTNNVLSMIDGKAELIAPGDCIGHGACKAACPVGAISLVFGTAQRGVELPVLTADFETNVAGIFIAGELGGMGLIRNALAQGVQAVEAIARRRPRRQGMADVLIVGAGPAGFAATLTAQSLGLSYVTIEQESLGGCVFQYPRAKLVMTAPVELPLLGKLRLTSTSKEELLEFWQRAERQTGIAIRYQERVESIKARGGGFIVKTTRTRYAAASVLLAIGRRGTPRKLGVPGEHLPKVVYRLIDPQQYNGQRVLVVGGGDAALETAADIAEATDARVAICYRGTSFIRAKTRNRQRLEAVRRRGRLHALMNSNVREIRPEAVVVEQRGKLLRIPNETVIVAAGGVVPTDFLQSVGVEVESKFGTA